MEKKRYIFGLILGSFLIFIFSSPPSSRAMTDMKCFSDCVNLGYSWDYCEQACSYETEWERREKEKKRRIPKTRIPKLDYQCFNDCLDLGYSYGYCKQVCTYY